MTELRLEDIAKQISESEQKLPPVDQWSPPFRGDLDMRIDREGRWFYLGSEIKRKPLVKLFSSILLKENGDYFLVTPVEKFRIRVDVAPLVVVSLETLEPADQPVLVMTTQVGDRVVIDKHHPLWVEEDDATAEPRPFVLVRRNLAALVHRNVFYELVNLARPCAEDPNTLCVYSSGQCFTLGQLKA